MWSQCLEQMRVNIGADGQARAARIKRQWSLLFPGNRPNLIEKSISNITRTHFLQEYFSPAYFIYIVRNGYVVSKGIQKKTNYKRWNSPFAAGGYPIELCAGQWKLSDDVMTKDSKALKRFHMIRYEDFVEDTERMLKGITDFLNISPMPSAILQREWSIHEANSSIVNMNPAGLARLAAEDFDRIESVAASVLQKYDYTRQS
jgi:hypothetical protein